MHPQARLNHNGTYRSSGSTAISVLFLLIFLFQFLQLSAQEKITDSAVTVRIQYIQKMLVQGKPKADLWWNGWLYGYTAATVGQGIIFLSNDKLSNRQDMVLGAATALIGVAGQLLTPMTPGQAPAKLALLAGDTPEERILKLKKAEELFEASAKREKDGRSWQMHAASGVVNLGGGLITWLGFKRSLGAGVANFALNTVITEAQIWSQPRRAIKDYKNYCEKYRYGLAYLPHTQQTRLLLNAFPGGLAVRLLF